MPTRRPYSWEKRMSNFGESVKAPVAIFARALHCSPIDCETVHSVSELPLNVKQMSAKVQPLETSENLRELIARSLRKACQPDRAVLSVKSGMNSSPRLTAFHSFASAYTAYLRYEPCSLFCVLFVVVVFCWVGCVLGSLVWCRCWVRISLSFAGLR